MTSSDTDIDEGDCCSRHRCTRDAEEVFDGDPVCGFHYALMRRGVYR